MRVGISLLTLVPGGLGGSETYVRSLTRALARSDEPEARAMQLEAFVSPLAPDGGGGLPTTVVSEFRAGNSGLARSAALARAALFPRRIRRHFAGLDAVHYPLTIPVPKVGAPALLTLHDVQHLDLPEHFGRTTRRFRARTYDRAAQEADAVIVISDFVRRRAVERLGLDETRVHVIPLGVDHALFARSDDVREPFLLYPARPWPHKNHRRLLEAFVLLRRELPELRLVLTGGGLESLGALPAGVEALGIVSVEKLASLYRKAACLVFPSLYEGFGLPPLEAMASGCPVAAANAGAIPEVCGGAAVYFDPLDPEAIANGVREALALADGLHEAGVARAAHFTWEAAATAHVSAYASLG